MIAVGRWSGPPFTHSAVYYKTYQATPRNVLLLSPYFNQGHPIGVSSCIARTQIFVALASSTETTTVPVSHINQRFGTKVSMAAGQVYHKGKANVQVFDSDEVLALALADYVIQLSDQFTRERGAFTVALSGGSLIKSLRKLVEVPYINSVDWSKWHVFWVDERVVPKDHSDSNYFLGYNDFLSKIPIPSGNTYAMNDALSAEAAADDYETCLKHLAKGKTLELSNSSGFPKFDLILLGMGPDGHVASLFPGHLALQENKKWVTFVKDSPKPSPERITLTLPVLNSSANIALVVVGTGKAGAVRDALGGGDDPNSIVLPVKMVSPEGTLSWFLDKEAASKL